MDTSETPRDLDRSQRDLNHPQRLAHTSRFRPRRNVRRWLVLAAISVIWIGARWAYDAANAKTSAERLRETNYVVTRIASPIEFILESANSEDDVLPARVRLIGVQPPWQWNNDPNRWESDTRQAVKEWIHDASVEIRLSRRQVAEDGVLLAHLCRDDELLSDFLVRQGWMAVDPDIDPSDGVIRKLYRAEDEARLAARGIWSGRALGMMDHPGL